MAQREHVRCMACGSWRTADTFGIGEEDAPAYLPGLAVQTIGGRGRCRWEYHDLPRPVAEELRATLPMALARLEAALGE